MNRDVHNGEEVGAMARKARLQEIHGELDRAKLVAKEKDTQAVAPTASPEPTAGLSEAPVRITVVLTEGLLAGLQAEGRRRKVTKTGPSTTSALVREAVENWLKPSRV